MVETVESVLLQWSKLGRLDTEFKLREELQNFFFSYVRKQLKTTLSTHFKKLIMKTAVGILN